MPVGSAFLRAIVALLLTIPVFIGFSYYLGATAIGNTLLKPSYVIDTLREKDVYNRIYDEFLIEPELDEWMGKLVGDFDMPDEDKARLLKEVIPPEVIQSELERSIDSLVTYLNDQSDDFEFIIDLNPHIASVKPITLEYLKQEIDRLQVQRSDTSAEFSREIEAYLVSIATGHVPDYLPVMDVSDTSELVIAYQRAVESFKSRSPFYEYATSRLEMESDEILGALQIGEVQRALNLAGQAVAAPRIDQAIADLEEDLDDQQRFDLISVIAEDSNRSRAQVLNDVNLTRFWIRFGLVLGGVIALAIMALATLAIALVFVPYWKHVFFWSGAVLAFSGLLFLVSGWLFTLDVGWAVSEICTGSGSTSCSLTLDLASGFASDVGSSFIVPSIIVVAIGVSSVVLSIIVSGLKGGDREMFYP